MLRKIYKRFNYMAGPTNGILSNTQNFLLTTADMNKRYVLPMCQDKFDYVIWNHL